MRKYTFYMRMQCEISFKLCQLLTLYSYVFGVEVSVLKFSRFVRRVHA